MKMPNNNKGAMVSHDPLIILFFCGAGGRNRTDMSLRSLDFESSASTNFTTPALLLSKITGFAASMSI